jgi:hypothetical protein
MRMEQCSNYIERGEPSSQRKTCLSVYLTLHVFGAVIPDTLIYFQLLQQISLVQQLELSYCVCHSVIYPPLIPH